MSSTVGKVYLIGAGPGDPGLLTLRGAECIRTADVILALNEDGLYGRLNRYRDQQVRSSTPLVKADAKVISISSYDLYMKGNYQTVERFHVDNCRALGDDPPGSGLAQAIRKAAWQFLVRPPRIDGKPIIGAWVRIRIEITPAGARAGAP